MKLKHSKSIALVLGVSMIASVVTGCSSAEGTDSTGKAKNDDKKQVLTMWGAWSGDQVGQLNEQLQRYNESQDKVTVKYMVQNGLEEKLLTAIAGGELPDILLWDRYNTGVYAPKGALEPITELVERDSIDLTDFYGPAVDEMTVDEELYGIPLLVDARVIFYNKEMFNEAGIEADSIKNWNDLKEAAVKLTKRDESGKLVQAGLSLKDPGLFNIWVTQAGGQLVTEDNPPQVAFNSPQGLEVLNFWDQLLNQDKVFELGFEDGFGGNGFKAKKVAMTYDGPWALADYEKAGVDFGLIQPPMGLSGDQGAFMGGFGLAIPKGSKNKDAAWDFIKWWTTQPENGVEFAKISGWIPANIEAANNEYFINNDNYKVFVNTMDYATIRPKSKGYSDVEGLALIPQLQKFMSGEITAEEALSKAEEQGNKIFMENNTDK